MLLSDVLQQTDIFRIKRMKGVCNKNNQVGLVNLLIGPFNPFLLHRIQRIMDTGGIHQNDLNIPDKQSVFDAVTRGSRNFGNNGPVPVEQQVHQAGFPDIGSSDDGDTNAFPKMAVCLILIQQISNRFNNGFIDPGNVWINCVLHIIRKIDGSLHSANDIQ